jgi:hypothetical protein
MTLLDHLVPAFSGEAYGDRGLLDDLPAGVWLTSTIRPMTINPTLGLVQSVYEPDKEQHRPARPDDFRYRVIVRDGQRRVERATLQIEGGAHYAASGRRPVLFGGLKPASQDPASSLRQHGGG